MPVAGNIAGWSCRSPCRYLKQLFEHPFMLTYVPFHFFCSPSSFDALVFFFLMKHSALTWWPKCSYYFLPSRQHGMSGCISKPIIAEQGELRLEMWGDPLRSPSIPLARKDEHWNWQINQISGFWFDEVVDLKTWQKSADAKELTWRVLEGGQYQIALKRFPCFRTQHGSSIPAVLVEPPGPFNPVASPSSLYFIHRR